MSYRILFGQDKRSRSSYRRPMKASQDTPNSFLTLLYQGSAGSTRKLPASLF